MHATDPEAALCEFHHVLKPGGTIALYEYDHSNMASALWKLKESMETINEYASTPSHARFDQGVLQAMLERAGFVDVVVSDLTVNVMPMLCLFFVLAYIFFLAISFLGLQT